MKDFVKLSRENGSSVFIKTNNIDCITAAMGKDDFTQIMTVGQQTGSKCYEVTETPEEIIKLINKG